MPNIASTPEMAAQIVKLTRLAVWSTLALAVLLLIADFLARGPVGDRPRLLSDGVLMALVYGMAAEIVAAIAAVACLAFLRKENGGISGGSTN
jgi:hypothetical protein